MIRTVRKVVNLVLMILVFAFNGVAFAQTKTYTIGISQFAEHPALDEVRRGFEDELKAQGIKANIIYKNSQGDTATSGLIAQKLVSDKVDLIFAIATISAQNAKQATKDIPIVFSAVTDPVHSQLVKSLDDVGGNVTGTSDRTPIDSQLALFKQLDPKIKKVGIIFNTSESNSEVQVKEAIEEAKKYDLKIVPVGVNNINDIPQAITSLMRKTDAFYATTDNIVASSIGLIAKHVNKNKMISVGAEEAHVKGGFLMTNGLSYYELGKQSADMAKKILVDGVSPSSIPVETAQTTTKVVNENTMKKLNLSKDNKAFEGAEFVK